MIDLSEQHIIASTLGSISGSVTLQGSIPSNPGLTGRLRKLNNYALVYVYSGNGIYVDENKYSQKIKPGSLLLLFPGLGHRYTPHKTWSEIFFILKGPAINSLEASGLISRQNPVLEVQPVEYWKNRLMKAVPKSSPSTESAVARNYFQVMQLLAEMIDESHMGDLNENDENWLARARRALEQSLTDEVSLDAAARRAGVASVDTFRKRFTRLHGSSPGNYRFQYQIEQASRLLRNSNEGLKEIAEQLGFHDAFHFSKRFKLATGISPSQFRSNYNKMEQIN